MSRAEKRAVAAAAALLVASLFVLVHPWFARNADAAMYLVTANSLADGEGYRFLGTPFVVRPPGFSALLAPWVAWRGMTDFAWLNGFVAVTGALGVAALYGLARPRLGWPLALGAAAALWLNPGYQRLCTSVLSDVPGLAAALGCLYWAARPTRPTSPVGREDATPSGGRDAALGLAMGLAGWLRSANLLLIPALVFARLAARSAGPTAWRAALLAPAVAVAVAVPWFVYAQWHAPAGPVDQTRLASYGTAMFHSDPGDPTSPRLGLGDLAARVPVRAVQLASVLGSRLETAVKGGRDDPLTGGDRQRAPGRAGPESAAGLWPLLLGGLLVASLVREAWIARTAASAFALGNVALLLGYFGFQDRLALPVFAIGGVAALAWLRDLSARFGGVARSAWLPGAALVCVVAVDLAPRAGWREIEAEHARLAAESAAVEPLLAPSARAAAWRGFHHGVFLERPIFSLHRSVGRLGAADGVEAVIDGYELDTIFLTTGGLAHVRDYLNGRYGPPERSGRAELWRVRGRQGVSGAE